MLIDPFKIYCTRQKCNKNITHIQNIKCLVWDLCNCICAEINYKQKNVTCIILTQLLRKATIKVYNHYKWHSTRQQVHEHFIYTCHRIRVEIFRIQIKRPKCVYRSGLTPNPGPVGGPVKEVSPPEGSQEKRPFLQEISLNKQKESARHELENLIIKSMYLGPGGGTLPALSSSIISSISLAVRSSWGRELKRNKRHQHKYDYV